LEVHIADVSHYIKPGSPMDKEAVERGNSTYLVDRVLPMLPVELSNGICSLKPDVDRLTKCAIIEISKDGHILNTKFVDAVIHSRAKLSYEQAQAILDGKGAPEGSDPTLVGSVKEAWKMAALLRKNRFANGALDLEMTEIKIKLDENGRACEAHTVVHTESHQLVEECMLIANQSVAKILRERSKPSIFRVHEDPDPSRLLDYTETAKQYGYTPGDLTNRSHIQALLDLSKGTAEEHQIKLGLLKSLKRAAYAADPLGHYGLAKTDYTHFTSPIRRYADLIVHRSLQGFLENPPKHPDRTPPQADLREIARHISETERTSSEAESETKQIKLLEYLELIASTDQSKNQGEETTFNGVITDVRPMGLMVEIPDMGVRGVVKREDLPRSSNWRFEAHNLAWTSFDGRRLALGMKLPLRIISIDKVKRFVDFAVAGAPTTEGIKPGKGTPRPPAKGHAKGTKKPTPKPAAKTGPQKKRGGSSRRRR
jgi:ribonuclease R